MMMLISQGWQRKRAKETKKKKSKTSSGLITLPNAVLFITSHTECVSLAIHHFPLGPPPHTFAVTTSSLAQRSHRLGAFIPQHRHPSAPTALLEPPTHSLGLIASRFRIFAAACHLASVPAARLAT